MAIAVYGATRVSLPLFEEGIASAATANGKVLVSIFMDGGADSLSILFPAGDPQYRGAAPEARARAGQGDAVRRGPAHVLAPGAPPACATLHGEQKLTVMPAVGYTHPDQSHFTSRHFWEVGATNAQLQTGWLGRVIDRIGRDDNPLQGLSLDYSLQPALATSSKPVASLDSPEGYNFWTPKVWGDVEQKMLATVAALGQRARAQPRPGDAPGGEGDRPVDAPAPAAAAVREPEDDEPRSRTRPRTTRSRSGCARSPRCSPRACRSACAALRAPGGYDTHSDQPKALEQGLKLTTDSLLAFQRDLEARGLADRVLDPRVVGVRAPRQGERLARHRPRRRGHRLPARHAGRPARWSASSPA